MARWLPWNADVMIASAAGESMAAPRPWPARAAKRAPAVPAIAGQRGCREDSETGHEEPASTEQISGTTAEESRLPKISE